MSVPWWPIPGCYHPSPVDGYCRHAASPAGKCTPWSCPINRAHRMPFKAAMVAARRDPEMPKDVTRRVITRTNSTVDGARWGKDAWARLDFDQAWADTSYADQGWGYLHVPLTDGDTVHRVRPVYEPGDLMLFGEELERDAPAAERHRREAIFPGTLARYSYDKALVRVDPAVAAAKGWSLAYEWWLEWPWKRATQPAVFCPKELVRDQAVVIAAGPVRLQHMSSEEALREGVSMRLATDLGISTPESEEEFNNYRARRVFMHLWDSINGERCPWGDNRFVWRIEATRWGKLKEVFGD